MQLSLLKNSSILLLFVTFFCVSCKGFKFEGASTSQQVSPNLNSTPKDRIKVMTAFPEDMEYTVIGKCKSAASKSDWQDTDGSYDAYKRLKDCACINGGNALVITNKTKEITNDYSSTRYSNNTLYGLPSSHSKVKLIGTVIYIKPNQYY